MTAEPALYRASVPVFLHYLDRIAGLIDKVAVQDQVLSARLAPDMFTCAEQLATAIDFAPRISYPLAGQTAPDTPDAGMDIVGLQKRLAAARAALVALNPADFDGAQDRTIQHRAGFAELDQSGADFLQLFGLPNFFFHLSMAFAVIRSQGIDIGKADFDGLHDYPQGFRF